MKTNKLRALSMLLFVMCGLARAAEPEAIPIRETRVVETYVPYDEFLKITGKDSNAAVMTLEEYRALVGLAAAQNRTAKVAPLPPIASSLVEASYEGRAGDFSVRFDVTFKVIVASKDWVRCDLGALQNLSHVTLDGQPGWILLEGGRAQLLVKGAGTHSGTLSFALPLQIEDDVQKLNASLLTSAAGSVHMTVPGRAIPSSNAGPLDSIYNALKDSTSFTAAVSVPGPGAGVGVGGIPSSVSLSWKRKYDSRKSDVLLQADSHISYLLNPSSPFYIWQSNVQIGRRKASELTFSEPPGCRTIRLSGSGVHSWLRDGGTLRVLLDEPTIGDVYIVASGLLEPPKGDFNLGAPVLKDALKNTRTLTLYEPPSATLAVVKAVGARELSLDEMPAIQRFQRPQWEGRLARQFFLEQLDGAIGVRVTPVVTIFDTRTAAYLTLNEKSISLRCTISIQPERGRLFALNLSVPPQWKLAGIQERGTGRGIVLEPLEEGKEDNWTIRLTDSAEATHPFNLDLAFALRDAEWTESAWQTHALNFQLPSITGARRSQSVLGVAAHASIDVAFGEMPGWHSDFADKVSRLGVSADALRAGLSSDQSAAEVRLNISHAPARGEYESVMHVQTTEHEIRVRADIRVLALERAQAIDELTLTLPADAKEPIDIAGKGVREIAPGAQPNQRIVRFNQAWREVRMLRVEYRAPLIAGTNVPVPELKLEGNFDSRRWIVFQSAGVVSLEVTPGESLLVASLDDTPSFANPIQTGRALFAFTFAPGGKYGSFRTTILETAPTLGNLVRDLKLTTVLDESGIARTHADMLLSYSRQYMETVLPADAKLLALCVDGENAQPVQGGSAHAIRIPIPPRSNARVDLVYEQDFGTLGAFGSMDAVAPEFLDFPVTATTWRVCYPAHYKFEISGGNITPLQSREPRYFWSQTVLGLGGSSPHIWSAWERENSEPAVQFERYQNANRSAQSNAAQLNNSAQELKPLEAVASRPASKDRAIGGLAIPEGLSLRAGKLGGSARVILSYRSRPFTAFAGRAVFIAAILAGVWLMLRRSLKAALIYTLSGLAVGTLLPLALSWESPLLMIPFCEGLTAFALLLLATYASRGLLRLLKRADAREGVAAAALIICAASLLTAFNNNARAAEPDQVLIPYPKDGKLPFDPAPAETKVYVPKTVYLELMNRVHPEKKETPIDAPMTRDTAPSIVPFSLGNAEYELSTDDASYSIKGTLEVTTYDPKGWTKFPLDFGPSRLVAMSIDGQPAGVANLGGALFVQLNGAKKFTLQFEVRGALVLEPGRASLRAQVIPGGATRLAALLPANVELDTKSLPSGAWIEKSPDGKMQRCELALDRSGMFMLSWHAAEIKGRSESRISSQSYMQFELGLDGYSVTRVERVTGDGAPVDQLSFKMGGEWSVANVAAPGLSEWTTSGEGADRHLRLWFQKPISAVTIQISGWAPLGSAEAPAAELSLENALRQEGFIGLKHGDGRHFAASSFGALKRASQEELSAAVSLQANAQPDRILHYNGTPGEAQVRAEPEPSQTSLETQYAGVFHETKMTVGARARYTVSGRGPLRHDVELPPNWDVRTVRATSMRDWEIVEINSKKHLIVQFAARAKTGDEIRWSAEVSIAVPATGALHMELPQPRAIEETKTAETVDWILAADASLGISQSSETSMQPVPVERAPRWVNLEVGQDWRLAFRSSKSDTRLAVDVSRLESALYATVVSFVSPAEEYLKVAARIRYRIEHAGRDRFLIRLPAGAELTELEANNLRGREWLPGATGGLLTVLMQSPVSGEQTIDLAYRMPRVPGKDALAEPPSIEDAGARSVEHYAGLLPSESGTTVRVSSSRLNPVKDAEELPFLPAGMSRKALTDVFAAEAGWSMTLRETVLKVEARGAAEVVTAELITTIGSDGGVRSVATYRVRNHSLQFLEIAMPPDSTLWNVSIGKGSASVSHRNSGGTDVLSIPLPRMTETDLPARISIVFESGRAPLPALYATYTPLAPRILDVPVVETHWRIYAPEDYDVSRSGGTMKEVVASVLDGSRVNSNIKEISRLAKIADVPEQRPAIRMRALQNMAVVQQELNDNVTALSAENGAAAGEAKRISHDDLQSQMMFNSDNLRIGNEWQARLNEKKRKSQLDAANSGNLDPEQVREYLDHFNFLNIHWRPGTLAKKEAEIVPPPPSEMTLDDLRFMIRFAGYRAGELPILAGAPGPELEKSVMAPSGLLETEPGRAALDSGISGFQIYEKHVNELRMIQLNFRGVEVHPELTLTFRSKSRTVSAEAWAALILGAGIVAGLWRWKTMKSKVRL